MIVDLKGVLQPGSADPDMDGFSGNMEENVISETAEALTSLGYSNMDALRAIRKVEGAESMTVEQLLSAALRKL